MAMYTGAVGVFSSFGRGGANNSTYGVMRILAPNGGTILWVRIGKNELTTFPCGLHSIVSVYTTPSGLVNPDGGGTSGDIIGDSAPLALPTQSAGAFIANCDNNQKIEVVFKLGSQDTLTYIPAADGYYEIKVNNVVKKRVDNIALGISGQAGWTGVSIGPNGRIDGGGSNGGMSYLYVNQVDTYGASSPVYERNFATATDAELWADLGGYWTRNNADGVNTPSLNGGRVVANVSMMTRNPLPVVVVTDNSDVCCDPKSATIVKAGGGQGKGARMNVSPSIGMQVECAGGGTVPTQADIVYPENWSA